MLLAVCVVSLLPAARFVVFPVVGIVYASLGLLRPDVRVMCLVSAVSAVGHAKPLWVCLVFLCLLCFIFSAAYHRIRSIPFLILIRKLVLQGRTKAYPRKTFSGPKDL